MALTNKLWRFWEGLNSGEIDWDFLNDDKNPRKERNKAAQMIISRGFVNAVETDKFPKSNSNNWKVICGYNMNPLYDEKLWYFKAKKYAEDYVSYLCIGNNKISCEYSIVEV